MNKVLLLITSVFVLAACVSFFRQNTHRKPAHALLTPGLYENSLREIPSSDDPTYSQLISLLQVKRPETTSALLEELSKSYPGFFKHFTLAYDSLSLHESSYENPRAIIYGKTGNLILTYNGHPDQRGYANLEIMEFDEIQGHKFREITFLREPHAEVDLTAAEIELRTQNYVVSKPNIGKCTQCHGQAVTKPIWQPYFVWPGIYGSDDDFVYRRLHSRETNLAMKSVERAADLNGPDLEWEGYLRYIEQKNTDRNVLINGTVKSAASRYTKLPVIASSPLGTDILSQDGRVKLVYERLQNQPIRPNLVLNRIISDQLTRLAFKKLKEQPSGKQAMLLLQLMRCPENLVQDMPYMHWKARVFSQIFPNFSELYGQQKILEGRQAYNARVEDFSRMDENFGSRLSLSTHPESIEPNTQVVASSLIGAPRLRTAQALAEVSTRAFTALDPFQKSGLALFDSQSTLSNMIFKNAGIDLQKIYSYDLRRSPNYEDGNQMHSFISRLPYELADLFGRQNPLNCADVRTLLENN